MTWKPSKRRLAIATTILIAFAILGSNLEKFARAAGAPFVAPHSRSNVVPYIAGNPLLITIEHVSYDASTSAKYAEIQDLKGKTLGYLSPVPAGATFPGQAVKGRRLTIKFDTSKYTKLPPDSASPMPMTTPLDIGQAAVMIISTNVGNDTPPADPIQLDPVPITP